MNFWSWGGKYIGPSYNNFLYSSNGTPIGRFENEILFDFNGKYIGEIMQENRIIVNNARTHLRSYISAVPANVAGSCCSDYVGFTMYVGYSDFKL